MLLREVYVKKRKQLSVPPRETAVPPGYITFY